MRYITKCTLSGIILGIGSANKRRSYNVTSSFIGWAHTQITPAFVSHGVLKTIPICSAVWSTYMYFAMFWCDLATVALPIYFKINSLVMEQSYDRLRPRDLRP